jgi:hypothetical protein
MNPIVQMPQVKPTLLERFGLYYLDFFKKRELTHNVFDFTDVELHKRINKITRKGMILSAITGIVLVFPSVWADFHFANAVWYIHYGWVYGLMTICTALEFYLLFIISLKSVYEVSDLINIHATKNDFLQTGVFGIKNILARTALEIPDPELKILGIDPFKQISKKNLFILGLIYKSKIIVTNLVLKNLLKIIFGPFMFGISILFEALPVEAFWNAVVLRRVVHEARLRLFGFALANRIAEDVVKNKDIQELSEQAKTGCLRAIGNAVVMAKNYHPNMIILLIEFQSLLQVKGEHKYDDWNLFIQTLQQVLEKERFFLLNLFTVAAAFDGKLSKLEAEHFKEVYGELLELYHPRIFQLAHHLRHGRLNAALDLCKLNFVAG